MRENKFIDSIKPFSMIPTEYESNEKEYFQKESIESILKRAKRMILSENEYNNYIQNFTSLFHQKIDGKVTLPKILNPISSFKTDLTNFSYTTNTDTMIKNNNNFIFSTETKVKSSSNYYTFQNRKSKGNHKSRYISKEGENTFNSYKMNFNISLNTNSLSKFNSPINKLIFNKSGSTKNNNLNYSLHAFSVPSSKKELTNNNADQDNLLSLDKLYDIEYNLSRYDIVSEIFNKFKQEEIKDYLYIKTKQLIESGTENLTLLKNKKFGSSDPKQKINYDLTIKSIGIIIKEKIPYSSASSINSNNNNDDILPLIEFKIDLPFSLLPLFYFTNMHYFKLVLSQIIKFEPNFTSARVDLEEITHVLSKYENQILNEREFREDANFILNDTKANNTIDIITPGKVFEMLILLPFVTFTLKDMSRTKNIFFIKKIDRQLMVYILHKNLVKWDFYILNYLSSYKLFRNSLLRFGNKNDDNLNYEEEDEKNDNFDLENFPQSKAHINLDLIRHSRFLSKSSSFSELKNYVLIFIFFDKSREIISIFLDLTPHQVEVVNNVLSNEQTSHLFTFNLYHMIILEKVKVLISVEEFIKKCLVINNKKNTMFLNYKKIEGVADDIKSCLSWFKEKVIKSIDLQPIIKLTSASINGYNIIKDEGTYCAKEFAIEIPAEGFATFESTEPSEWSFFIKKYLNGVIISNYETYNTSPQSSFASSPIHRVKNLNRHSPNNTANQLDEPVIKIKKKFLRKSTMVKK